MTRLTTFGSTALLAVVSAVASVPVAGCSGTPPGEFIIVQNQVPNADCSIPAGLGQVYRGEGVLDVRLIGNGTTGYQLFPVMQNNFPAPAGGQTVDANRIALSGFNVDVTVTDEATDDVATVIRGLRDGNDPMVKFGTLTSGSVASGGGYTSSAVEVFPADLASSILSMGILSQTKTSWVLASVRALGKTLAGDVTSDAFKYPIQLCDGCLMDNLGACPVSTTTGSQCYIGQDGATGCCSQNGQLFCPALVANK